MWSAQIISYNNLAFSVMRWWVWMITWSSTNLNRRSFVKSTWLCMESNIICWCSDFRAESFSSIISIYCTSSSESRSLILSYWLSSWWRIIYSRTWKSLMIISRIFSPIITIFSLLWSWHYNYKLSTFTIQKVGASMFS